MLERPSDDSDPADAAIEEYLRLLDAGVEVDRSAFIASHPEAAKELRSFFGSLSMLQKLAGAGGLAQNYGSELTTRSSRDAAGRKRSEDEGGDSRLPWTSLPAMFGRYRVESLLGRGAMGAVYRAHDTQLDRPVALKLSHLPENIVFELRERMLQEARAAAALSNPNICRVYDVGEIGGTRFIAMELIEGRPLADYIRSGRLMPIKTAVAIIRKLALALKAAHDKGVVHRDLKPTNVIINADHEPILMDFGLAQRPVATGEERLTKEGMLIGSPAYMSPEQARADGTSIGPASDIYSLGVVFYELLTGQLPFTGSVMTILAKVLSEVPPTPQSIRPEIDRDLSDVCHKMLAKLPQERFVSMEEVAECLQRWLKSVAKTSQNTASKTESSAKSGAPSRPTPNQAKSSIISKPESVGNATVRGNQDDFDGYRKWLGITSKSRPPSHYELLKISLDEDDDDVIKAAAEQRRHYVESQRGQGYDDSVAEIVYRIHEAEITLLSSEMRREYDRQLGLFEKRRKNRRVDPFAPVPRVKSRPGPTVGEDNGIVKTFAGIVAVLCIAFAGMAIFAFKVLPWSKQLDPETALPERQVHAPEQVLEAPAQVPPIPKIPALQAERLHKNEYQNYLRQAQEALNIGNRELAIKSLELCPLQHRHWEWYRLQLHVSADAKLVEGQSIADTTIETPAPVWNLQWSPDGKMLAICGGNYQNSRHTKPFLAIRYRHTDATKYLDISFKTTVMDLAWSPDSNALAAVSHFDKSIEIWDIPSRTRKSLIQAQVGTRLSWNPLDSTVFTSSKIGIEVFDSNTGHKKATYPNLHGEIVISPDGHRFSLTDRSGNVSVGDTVTGNVTTRTAGHSRAANRAKWSPDVSRFATVSIEPVAKVWKTQTGELELQLKHSGEAFGLDWSPDGQRLITVGKRSESELSENILWDTQDGAELFRFPQSPNPGGNASWHPDGKLIAISYEAPYVKIWSSSLLTSETKLR